MAYELEKIINLLQFLCREGLYPAVFIVTTGNINKVFGPGLTHVNTWDPSWLFFLQNHPMWQELLASYSAFDEGGQWSLKGCRTCSSSKLGSWGANNHFCLLGLPMSLNMLWPLTNMDYKVYTQKSHSFRALDSWLHVYQTVSDSWSKWSPDWRHP